MRAFYDRVSMVVTVGAIDKCLHLQTMSNNSETFEIPAQFFVNLIYGQIAYGTQSMAGVNAWWRDPLQVMRTMHPMGRFCMFVWRFLLDYYYRIVNKCHKFTKESNSRVQTNR